MSDDIDEIKTRQAIENLVTMSHHYLKIWDRRERIKTIVENVALLSIASLAVSVIGAILWGA